MFNDDELNDLFKSIFGKGFLKNFNEDDFFNEKLRINDGDESITEGKLDDGTTWFKKEWSSSDGVSKITSITFNYDNSNLEKNKRYKKELTKEDIEKQIQIAVKKEDYETAALLKKKLDEMNYPNDGM